MLAHTTSKVPLAPTAEIRENTKTISLDASKWSTVKQIRSEGVFTDPVLGNVIEHVAAETEAGKIVYIGTRLKVADSKITEVEINFDDGSRVNAKNLIPYDPFFNTIVPEGERSTREQLERIINSYFQGLTDHKPIEADYDPRCDRYHVETASLTTLETESKAVAMWAATRATLVRSRGDQRPKLESPWSILNGAL